jgi:hypothetical protein
MDNYICPIKWLTKEELTEMFKKQDGEAVGKVITQEQLDHTVLNFGKHKGKTPDLVSKIDSNYIVWLYENITTKLCSRALYLACQLDMRTTHQDDSEDPYGEDTSTTGYD